MIPRLLKVCLVYSVFAVALNAQKGGQPPAPAPAPQPNPPTRQPSPAPDPTPGPANQPTQNVTIRGRIITDGSELPVTQLEVRFETDGGQPLGFAYADSSGQFTFQGSGIPTDQGLYVVIKLDGYKPYRELVGGPFGMNSFGGMMTIFMERETTIRIDKSGGSSIVDLKQLRTKVPPKAVDEYEKALKESSKGNTGKAVEGLERAIKLAPNFFEAQNSLGAEYLRMQKYQDAETALLRAKDLGPKAEGPLINLGMLYYQRGEMQGDAGQQEEAAATFQKAVEVLDESVKLNPLSALAHSYLGAALYKLASYERAESVLNRALELDDQQQDARLMLINVYTKKTRFKDALELIKTFLIKNPKAPQRAALEGIKTQIEQALAKQQ
jgi:Flp pilus assembly protein TadD